MKLSSSGASSSVVLILIVVLAVTTSAQITFNKHWLRGQYSNNENEDGEGPLGPGYPGGGAMPAPALPKRIFGRYTRPAASTTDNDPSIISGQVLKWLGSKNLRLIPYWKNPTYDATQL